MALVAPVENGKIVETASQTSVSKAAKSSSGMDKEDRKSTPTKIGRAHV